MGTLSPGRLHNATVARVFGEIADLLEIADENPFRVRAYRNAARTIGAMARSVQAMVAQGADLDALPGIGPDLAGKITEIVTTGRCALLDRLHRQFPPAVGELLRLPGIGPKRVRLLVDELGVRSLAELQRAAQQGRIRGVAGFGPRTEAQILQASERQLHEPRRWRRVEAQGIADALLGMLRALPGVRQAVAAGSLRRGRDTVGDLDLLVITAGPGHETMQRFAEMAGVREVLALGDTRASVVLASGLQVDLRAVAPESFGAAWVYFTGSKAHNIALRRLAQQHGLKINEYGVFRGRERIAGETEESVYATVGLPWIAPELREDRGELEVARGGRLPALVRREDLRADLHVHTLDSDGHDSLERMAAAARERGLEYIAITDHSQRLKVAGGLDPIRLEKQMARIDRLNETLAGLTVLKGVEVDILEDGTLDLPDSLLQRLDLVVGALHSRLALPRAKQTARVLRALDHPRLHVLAHPSARLIGERPGADIDLLRIVRHAKACGAFLELNGQSARLDLDDAGCRMARQEGVLVSIASDAHSVLEYDNLGHGVVQARRGWLEKADVLNTRSLPELRALLRR